MTETPWQENCPNKSKRYKNTRRFETKTHKNFEQYNTERWKTNREKERVVIKRQKNLDNSIKHIENLSKHEKGLRNNFVKNLGYENKMK
jgi:hypothetical protein